MPNPVAALKRGHRGGHGAEGPAARLVVVDQLKAEGALGRYPLAPARDQTGAMFAARAPFVAALHVGPAHDVPDRVGEAGLVVGLSISAASDRRLGDPSFGDHAQEG